MPEREPLGFGGVYASAGDHIGHFYQTKQEQRDILSAYIKAGLDADETCVSLHPRPEREDLEKALAAVGIDVGGGSSREDREPHVFGRDPCPTGYW